VPGAGDSSPAPGFGARLAAAVTARESQIVLGIDPDPARLWPDPAEASGKQRERVAIALVDTAEAAGALAPAPAAAEAAAAVLVHCRALIDAAGPACVAVKPQLACFERLGSAGWHALEAACEHARAAGLLVLADGKRGDVPVTATAYAQTLVGSTPSPFGAVPGLGVDAFTANPLLGRDALVPLVEGARAAGAGVFLLVRTSNPGAADVFDLPLASGAPLWEHLARLAAELGEGGWPGHGLHDVGAVTGATVPEHLARMRELMPRTPFLLPGVGAQGGDVRDLAPAFAAGRAGGLVTASRSIANAHEQRGGTPAEAARAEAERLRELAWGLG
jgi:orotidine-5'-phosphate decarboxylase